MVTGSRIEGGPQILTAGVRKTIQSIKEIVGNHSDAEIYVTLKETNMDPNETTQKLLNQDPFHEVKRKRDKKKEGTSSLVSVTAESRKNNENGSQVAKANNYSDRGVRRVGYARNALTDAGVSREFRVVRDNRSTQNTNREVKPPIRSSSSTSEQPIANESGKSSSGAFIKEKASSGRHSSHSFTGQPNSHPKQDNNANVNSSDKGFMREITPSLTNSASKVNAVKPNDSRPHSTMSSNGSVIGVYSSSSDPVHVPSPVSRPAANVGAIKREVGVVGVRRSQNSAKPSSPNLHFGRARDNTPSGEPIQSLTLTPDSDHPSQSNGAESSSSNVPVNRSFVGNQYNNKPHQQTTGHQKALQPNKEWKPKTSQRSSDIHPGVIGTPPNSTPSLADNSEDLEIEDAQLQDKLSRVHFSENQNVIIAAHIRVSESDRCRLTFGSFGTEFDSSRNLGYGSVGVTEDPLAEPSASLSVSAPESSGDEISSNKPVDLSDDGGRNSRSNSPVPVEVSERQFTEEKGTSSPQKMDNYEEIGLVRDNSSTFTPLESQQRQDPPELPNFSEAYDPQAGYDLPYFRPAVDDTVRGQGLPSPQEAFGSYSVNNIPAASSMAMVQQQPPLAQMFPQVHVSHFANLMPYRQFLSPVYVPPMAMPGYSSNPAYAHPPNGSSYLLMPGGGTHLTANGVKYGIQQLKPVPAGSPTGFGNFTNPSGFAINAPGVVGSAPGLEDSSRLKYKDGNHYVPNPQAETAEIWMNPRELSSMQSPSYYNMAGQPPPHAAAYMPSHTSHTSFNAGAAAAQSSHMQFPPGLYHHPPPPPQAGAIANPHHLGPPAAAPGAPVGAYQQSQLGHMNWTGNF